MPTEDPRVHGDICGVREIGATGIEWICVKKPHAKIYKRKVGDPNHHRGAPIFSNAPAVDSHYMINRWPNRDKQPI